VTQFDTSSHECNHCLKQKISFNDINLGLLLDLQLGFRNCSILRANHQIIVKLEITHGEKLILFL